MKPESIVTGLAGVLFGLLCGWMLGAQQAAPVASPAPVPAAQGTPAPGAPSGQPAQGTSTPAPLDTARVQQLEAEAGRNPRDARVRTQLGNLFFDADRYADAARWYEASLAVAPDDPNVSTDLAVSYYYLGQTDRALTQFARSLEIDPKHTKTLLNLGIVRAFGKQDLAGAAEVWTQVVALAPPESPEGRAARQALEGLKAAHPELGPGADAAAGKQGG